MADINRGAFSPREKVFLFIGQLEPHKGVLTLIGAYERYLMAETEPWRLAIVGNGSLRDTVCAFVSNRNGQVIHEPYTPETESAWLSRAGALVVPSLCYENSPIVIYRAATVGLPVLASDIGGIGELTGKCRGQTFEPNDEIALADALSQIQKIPGSSGVESIVLGPSPKDYVNGLLAAAGIII